MPSNPGVVGCNLRLTSWARICICITALAAYSACSRLSPTERRIIGQWVSKDDTEITSAFKTDRTCTWSRQGQVRATGKWRIEGDYLITEFETQSKDIKLPNQLRERIARLTTKELIFTDGQMEGYWARIP